MTKFALVIGLAGAILTGASAVPVLAYDITSTAPINVTAARIALSSYDPVAYFTVGKPVLGKQAYSAEYNGAIYRFSSKANRAAFRADPAKYAPLHGGFCQMGAALGKKLDGDPTLFRVANGKLAVFSYKAAQDGFLKDVAGNTAKAEGNWPKIKDKAPSEL